jgi:hypothetical protein
MAQPPKIGFRFQVGGINLTSVPDSITPEKYACLYNVRFYSPTSVRTRPGYNPFFSTGNAGITDIQSYTAIETDNLPRYLARDANGNVWLDSGANNTAGVNVGNMAAPQGFGASMNPYRPSASPQSWMYISTDGDYQKFSAPDSNNNVTQYKVGIAEPQIQVEAAPQAPAFTDFTGNASNWSASGTAGSPSNSTILSDTAGATYPDPVIATRQSVLVTTYYLIGSSILVNSAVKLIVQDYIPFIATCTINAIRYSSGTTGHCIITVGPLPFGEGPTTATILGSLRRGAVVVLTAEGVLVLSVTTGPNGAVDFECSTVSNHIAGETITGATAIVVDGTITTGQSIVQNDVASTITTGTGTLSQNLSSNPFQTQLGSSGIFPTPDDYIRMVVQVSSIATFTQLQIVFVIGADGTFTFTANALDNLEAGQLAIVEFPISALVASGSNISLSNCTSVQVSVLTSGTQSFALASLIVSGGGLPDIGDTGAPYQYRIIGRSTATGAQGNPSPVMRYGVSPRRQSVTIPLPAVSAALPANDPQVDIWDVYRVGGSATTYGYIGSGLPSTDFIDQYFDDTPQANIANGKGLPTQQFEPWPSVDVPYKIMSGGGTTITVVGTQIVITGPTSWPATINNWLPGTLINLGGQAAYTLRRRPTQLSSTSYLFDIEECAGNPTVSLFTINEPNVARQIAPYVWGPDVNGYFFAVGDPLRPGIVYFATPNSPDMTASSNTVEPSTPSEPMLNGLIVDGLSYVASSARWWKMYPAFSGSSVFQPFQAEVGRGLASPRGIATDGISIFFWAKDGICRTGGAGFDSLTDADLFQLFPHDQIAGSNIVRNNITFYAPDYSRAAEFRLTHINGFLYADYRDSTDTPRTLVCYLKTVAWSQDAYHDSMISRCAIAQPEGTLTSTPNENYGLSVMADKAGKVWRAANLTSDGGNVSGFSITAVVGTFEWDGQPDRQSGTWENFYLDLIPAAAGNVQVAPVLFGSAVTSATTILSSTQRALVEVSTGSGANFRYLGLQIVWTDDYTVQSTATVLYSWRNFADPDSVTSWKTQAQTFGLHGYVHCGRMEITYSSNSVVTLNIAAFDGTSSAVMTIPSTGGEVQKILVTPTFNKGQLLSVSASSTQAFWMSVKDTLLWLKQWGSNGPYLTYRLGAEEATKP